MTYKNTLMKELLIEFPHEVPSVDVIADEPKSNTKIANDLMTRSTPIATGGRYKSI